MKTQTELPEFRGESETCPVCERRFDSSIGMKVHHKEKHGKSIKTRFSVTCENCGETYKCSKADLGERRFCSNRCRTEHQQKDCRHVRKSVFKRDGGRCQRCGCNVSMSQMDSQKTAETHHLIPKSAGGPDTPENLLLLCRSCHEDAHNILKKVDEQCPNVLQKLRRLVCEADIESR